MKNASIIFLGIVLAMVGCDTQNLNQKTQRQLKGTWEVVDISYEKLKEREVKSQLFELADKSCFEGSMWKLVSNNNTGLITVNPSSECQGTVMSIVWTITNTRGYDEFEFKRIMPGQKPKDVLVGYKLQYIPVSEQQFILKETVPFEDQGATLIYTFNRVQ